MSKIVVYPGGCCCASARFASALSISLSSSSYSTSSSSSSSESSSSESSASSSFLSISLPSSFSSISLYEISEAVFASSIAVSGSAITPSSSAASISGASASGGAGSGSSACCFTATMSGVEDFACTSCANANGPISMCVQPNGDYVSDDTFTVACGGQPIVYEWVITTSGKFYAHQISGPSDFDNLVIYSFTPPITCGNCINAGYVSNLSACQGWPANVTLMPSTGGICTACCTNAPAIPNTLYATLANVLDCTCVNEVITLTYDGVSAWTGTGSTGSGCTGGPYSITLSLTCTGTSCSGFSLAVSGCTSTTISPPDSCSCDPISASFTVATGFLCGCTGLSNKFTVSITE